MGQTEMSFDRGGTSAFEFGELWVGIPELATVVLLGVALALARRR